LESSPDRTFKNLPAAVLCMGCATMDYIFSVRELPREPLKFRARDFKAVGGGNAATAAVAIARLGGRAHLIARLGDDSTGDAILRELDGYGVESSLVRRFAGCASLLSSILIDEKGERQIVSYFDPKISHEPDWLPQIPAGIGAVLADAHWLAGDLELFRRAAAAGIPTILDADMPSCAPELIRASTVAAFSAPGLEAATGAREIPEGLQIAARMGGGVMMVTDGAAGVFWLEGGEVRHHPAYRVEAVDTLGAGDVFHGAFALALAEGQAIDGAVAFASAVAAIKVTRFGGRAGTPTRAEVEQFLLAQGRAPGSARDPA
jgi:sulfofructose kinase